MHESGICNKCSGGKWIVIGILILLNAVFNALDWGIFFGVLLILKGIVCIAKPTCGHVVSAPVSKGSKKK